MWWFLVIHKPAKCLVSLKRQTLNWILSFFVSSVQSLFYEIFRTSATERQFVRGRSIKNSFERIENLTDIFVYKPCNGNNAPPRNIWGMRRKDQVPLLKCTRFRGNHVLRYTFGKLSSPSSSCKELQILRFCIKSTYMISLKATPSLHLWQILSPQNFGAYSVTFYSQSNGHGVAHKFLHYIICKIVHSLVGGREFFKRFFFWTLLWVPNFLC